MIELHLRSIKGQSVVHRVVVNGLNMAFTSRPLDVDGLLRFTLDGVIPEQAEEIITAQKNKESLRQLQKMIGKT